MEFLFSFFQVFFLVVAFGLFNGMVFLPVILSLIGPAPYADHTNLSKAAEACENNNTQTKVNPMTGPVDGKLISFPRIVT